MPQEFDYLRNLFMNYPLFEIRKVDNRQERKDTMEARNVALRQQREKSV